MNKKLLKGALLSLSSILMAISCSTNDSTGPGATTRTEISRDDVNAFIKRIDGASVGTEDGKLTISQSENIDSQNEIHVTVTDSFRFYDVRSAIAEALKTPTNNISGIYVGNIEYPNEKTITSVTAPVTFTVRLHPEDDTKYTLSISEVKVIVTPSPTTAWKKIEIGAFELQENIVSALKPFSIGSTSISLLFTGNISFASSSKGKLSIIIDVSEYINNTTKASKTAGEAALNTKFQQIKEKLDSIGIKINTTSFGTFTSSTVNLSTTVSATEYALYGLSFRQNDITGSYSGPLTDITITLKAGADWK